MDGAVQQAPHWGRHGKGADMESGNGVVEVRKYTLV